MLRRLEDARILMYSHDTFGLGHLRRCRTIAHSLVEDFRGLNVLIISGATIAGAFDYRARVDFVKIPSVIKLRNGEYTSMERHIDLHETLKMRQSIIRHTAETFQPDIFIVDKEPMGLRGEIEETLAYLKARGTTLILGLREVMDAPDLLDAEWKRNDVMRKIGKLYDMIWVYGPPEFYDPLNGLDVPANVRAKMKFVGFLQRCPVEERRAGSSTQRRLHTGHDGRRRRRRRTHPQRDPRLSAGSRPQPSRADRARPLHAGQEASQADAQGRRHSFHRDDRVRQPDGRADRRGQGGRRHGRLQHLLRDIVVRQAGADRTACGAAPGAIDPRPNGRPSSASSKCCCPRRQTTQSASPRR